MENNSLPEKCCAKCGFLFGLASSPDSSGDAILDPDIIREESYDGPEKFPVISTIGYFQTPLKLPIPEISHLTETRELTAHTWNNTSSICCYRKKFDPLDPIWETVKPEIQKNREDCDGFYQHHFGYTPKQHTELQLNEQRFQQQEEHTRTLLDLQEQSNKTEERILNLQEQSNKTGKSLTSATWVLAFVTFGLLLATIVLIIVTILTQP